MNKSKLPELKLVIDKVDYLYKCLRDNEQPKSFQLQLILLKQYATELYDTIIELELDNLHTDLRAVPVSTAVAPPPVAVVPPVIVALAAAAADPIIEPIAETPPPAPEPVVENIAVETAAEPPMAEIVEEVITAEHETIIEETTAAIEEAIEETSTAVAESTDLPEATLEPVEAAASAELLPEAEIAEEPLALAEITEPVVTLAAADADTASIRTAAAEQEIEIEINIPEVVTAEADLKAEEPTLSLPKEMLQAAAEADHNATEVFDNNLIQKIRDKSPVEVLAKKSEQLKEAAKEQAASLSSKFSTGWDSLKTEAEEAAESVKNKAAAWSGAPTEILSDIKDKAADTFNNATALLDNLKDTVSEKIETPTNLNERFAAKDEGSHDTVERLNGAAANGKFNISFNQRFTFLSELFGGDTAVYEKTIHDLNQSNSVIEAFTYLNLNIKPKYHWDNSDSTVREFLDIVKSRFLW